ncbi:hypothetical protein EB093_04055 [bacterium]|nr:hypothetical protein [bacterium]
MGNTDHDLMPIINPIAHAITVFLGNSTTTQSTWVSSSSELAANVSDLGPDDRNAADSYFANGGQHLIFVPLPRVSNPRDVEAALATLGRFDLVVIAPSLAHMYRDLATVVAQICDKREAILLLDAPQESDPNNVIEWLNRNPSIKQKHVAVYYPPVNKIGASFSVAGMLNRLDQSFGPWTNPSGSVAQIQGGVTPSIILTNEQTIRLNNAGVNCIRTFKSIGTVVWGSTTTLGFDHPNPYWKYIHVRRTLYFIKHSIIESVKPIRAASTDADLSNNIFAVVEPFLLELSTRGAFVTQGGHFGYDLSVENRVDEVHISLGLAIIKPDELVTVTVRLAKI